MKGSIGLKVQLVKRFNWSKGSIESRSRVNWFKGSIGSWVQFVQENYWFKGSINSRVQLLQGLNWLKGSIGSGFKGSNS